MSVWDPWRMFKGALMIDVTLGFIRVCWEVVMGCNILYNPSSGWESLTFRQDPLHSDDDVTEYMWHSPLQSMASWLSSSLLLSDHVLLSELLLSKPTTHGQTFSTDFHKVQLSTMCLMTSARLVAPITVEEMWRMW